MGFLLGVLSVTTACQPASGPTSSQIPHDAQDPQEKPQTSAPEPAAGLTVPGNNASEADTLAARQVLDDFMTAFNARDVPAWRKTLHYPHVRFASDSVIVSPAPEDFTLDFEQFATATGWHHSAWDSVVPVHSSPDKVHFDVQFSRYRESGEQLAIYRSLYIVTRKEIDGVSHWGIQSRSSFAP